jgi:hypothetical protein
MKRNLIFRTALLLILAMLYAGTPGTHGSGIRSVLAAEPGPSQPAPQPPKAIPAQPGFNQGGSQNDRPRPTTGMGGMAGMRGQPAASAAQVPLQSAQQAPQSPALQSMTPMGRPTEQGLTMREVLYLLSIQDALQVMTDLLAIQEKLLSDPKGAEKENLRKELMRLKEQARKITGDYRDVLSSQLRGE